MADMHHYTTAISKIVSDANDEDLILRGHRLSELIRTASFSQAVFLMLTGHMPSPGQARTLDAVMTACVDHGVTPAAMIGRAFASYGTSVTAAVAGGILMFGTIAGGAGDALAHNMVAAMESHRPGGGDVTDSDIADIARCMVDDGLRSGGRVVGFGIPAHDFDPRAPALLAVAQETGAAGVYCRLLIAMEDALAKTKGRRIAINLDGIVAAVILDLGLPEECAAAFVMIPRSFSTLAHHLEEKQQRTKDPGQYYLVNTEGVREWSRQGAFCGQ